MGQLTLQLPETLHRQLEGWAMQEGVSLNQYVVYALTRHAAAYVVRAVPGHEVRQQQRAFETLLERLGPPATPEELDKALAAREPVAPEPSLDQQVGTRTNQEVAQVNMSG